MHVLWSCGRRVQTEASSMTITISRGVTSENPEACRVKLDEQISNRRQTVVPEDFPMMQVT